MRAWLESVGGKTVATRGRPWAAGRTSPRYVVALRAESAVPSEGVSMSAGGHGVDGVGRPGGGAGGGQPARATGGKGAGGAGGEDEGLAAGAAAMWARVPCPARTPAVAATR